MYENVNKYDQTNTAVVKNENNLGILIGLNYHQTKRNLTLKFVA
jgi:urease beta subunit